MFELDRNGVKVKQHAKNRTKMSFIYIKSYDPHIE